MKRNVHPQRAATLPPLNVSRTESPEANVYKYNESDTTNYFQRVAAAQPTTVIKKPASHLVEAAQTVLFTASSLQRTVSRCIDCIGNDSLSAAFSPALYKSKSSTEKLVHCLDSVEKKATAESCTDLLHTTVQCIVILKELCFTLRTRLSTLVQGLDAKFSRNLLMNIYSTTVDIKDAWETIRPYLAVHPSTVLKSSTPTHYKNELTAHSPITHPCTPPSSNGLGGGGGDNSQLYSHLRNAVTGSLHVLNTLGQSIEETLQDSKTSISLEKKLSELLQQAKYATELSNRLDKNVEANMGNNKEDLLLLPTKTESSRRIWEDTSLYLKVFCKWIWITHLIC
jgi:hypothetical protein